MTLGGCRARVRVCAHTYARAHGSPERKHRRLEHVP
jgi:hypothetical protein